MSELIANITISSTYNLNRINFVFLLGDDKPDVAFAMFDVLVATCLSLSSGRDVVVLLLGVTGLGLQFSGFSPINMFQTKNL